MHCDNSKFLEFTNKGSQKSKLSEIKITRKTVILDVI